MDYFTTRAVSDPARFGVTNTEAGFRIPIYSLHTGDEAGYEIRLHEATPDRKYDRPVGQRNMLNHDPAMRDAILDAKKTLFLVEGATRHMALAERGQAAVSMTGCWGWKNGETAVLPEFDVLPLKGRRVVVVLDGDVTTKVGVNLALHRLATYLTQKGAARVEWVDLPPSQGLDDWLAAGHSLWDLSDLTRSMEELPELTQPRMTRDRMAERKGLPDTTDEALAELWVLSDPTHAVRIKGTDTWYTYGSGHWFQDKTRNGLDARASLARLLTRVADMYTDAAETDSEKKVAAETYRDLRSAAKLGAVYSRFQSLPRDMICVDDEVFDRDPYLLNVANGTVDLRDGQLRAHNPSDRLRGQSPTAYVPGASADRWTQFLSEVFPGQDDVVTYLQLILGASLIGSPILHILPVFVGTGRNGKGTLVRAITRALGRDYMGACDKTLLLSSKYESHPTKLMALKGKRLVAASETEAGERLATASLKMLTGGDEIAARGMREDLQTFMPSHSMILQTNNLPEADAMDQALWARLRLIRFNISFADAPDVSIDEKLATEAEGVLAWLVEGCRRFLQGGKELETPLTVTMATGSWQMEENQFLQFASERIVVDPKAQTDTNALQEAYSAWCRDRGETQELRARAWGAAVRSLNPLVEQGRTGAKRYWKGLRLVTATTSDVFMTDSVTDSIHSTTTIHAGQTPTVTDMTDMTDYSTPPPCDPSSATEPVAKELGMQEEPVIPSYPSLQPPDQQKLDDTSVTPIGHYDRDRAYLDLWPGDV